MLESMKRMWTGKCAAGALACVAITLLTAGCPRNIDNAIDTIADRFDREFDVIQGSDPRSIVLPPAAIAAGNTVVIDADVQIITDVRADLVIEDLPDITIVGLENLTGLDLLVTYIVDDPFAPSREEQTVFVFDGESLLLEYFCLDSIELVAEEYYDPFTGEFVVAFDTFPPEGDFLNGQDFFCGEALIFSFEVDGVFTFAEPIDL